MHHSKAISSFTRVESVKSKNLTKVFALTIGIFLISLSFANIARANGEQVTRQYLAADGFLCGLSLTACPDVAVAGNGDKIAISGSGTFTPGSDVSTGGGTFTHTNSAGTVLGTGTWHAEELVSFTSFGTASPTSSLEGGIVVLQVELESTSGATLHAILTIGCLLGTPPAGSFEGIHLNVVGGPDFSTTVSGITVFVQLSDQ